MKNMLQDTFPGLRDTKFEVTSLPDMSYNCHAYAIGDESNWHDHLQKWPDSVPRDPAAESYRQRYKVLGFEDTSEAFDPDYDHIAVFADLNGMATHSAKRLDVTKWGSKLGKEWDIAHDLRALEGHMYGRVVLFMRRKRLSTS